MGIVKRTFWCLTLGGSGAVRKETDDACSLERLLPWLKRLGGVHFNVRHCVREGNSFGVVGDNRVEAAAAPGGGRDGVIVLQGPPARLAANGRDFDGAPRCRRFKSVDNDLEHLPRNVFMPPSCASPPYSCSTICS